MVTSYEAQREANIAANKAILASLGLEAPAPPSRKPSHIGPKHKSATKKRSPNPRKSLPARTKTKPTPTDVSDDEPTDNRRRSTRLKRAAQRSLAEKDLELPSDYDEFENSDEEADYSGSEDGCTRPYKGYSRSKEKGFLKGVVGGRSVLRYDEQPRKNCKYYGAPDVPVGTWWPMRTFVARDGVHAPWVAGIYGDPEKGAYSVALSGGYEDDVDEGFRFTYTGEGGRNLKGTKSNPKNLRTAPQTRDQTLSRGNASLVASVKTKRPVRVVRGFKAGGKFAPRTGYRYDGLYEVCKAWTEIGLAGFKVYKFAFKRLDGQPPLDLKDGTPMESQASESEVDVETEAREGSVTEVHEELAEEVVKEVTNKRKRKDETTSEVQSGATDNHKVVKRRRGSGEAIGIIDLSESELNVEVNQEAAEDLAVTDPKEGSRVRRSPRRAKH